MPGYDQTGPMGEGAGTGRGLGRCSGDRFNGGRANGGQGDGTTRLMQQLRRRRCRRDPVAAMDASGGDGGRRGSPWQRIEGPERPLRGQGAGGGRDRNGYGGGRRR